jgi:hypothetical protein
LQPSSIERSLRLFEVGLPGIRPVDRREFSARITKRDVTAVTYNPTK